MKIDGAIFDLDGTLLDSMKIWETLGEDYLYSLMIQPEQDLSEKIKNMSLMQSAHYFQETYGIEKSVEEIISGINRMIEDFYMNSVQLKNGVKDYLVKLYNQQVKLCIATATDYYLVEAALKRLAILNLFDFIITCQEVGSGKDQSVIYEEALKRLGTPKEKTFVFEDALYAIVTAKKANFNVIGVYDASEKEQIKVKELSDDYIYEF